LLARFFRSIQVSEWTTLKDTRGVQSELRAIDAKVDSHLHPMLFAAPNSSRLIGACNTHSSTIAEHEDSRRAILLLAEILGRQIRRTPRRSFASGNKSETEDNQRGSGNHRRPRHYAIEQFGSR